MRKFFYLALFIILGFHLVLASDVTLPYNKEFDLKRACSDRGFFCDSTFKCNITITQPDGSAMLNNKVMSFNFTYRNITIPASFVNQMGYGQGIMSCNNGTDAGQETFDIIITADGNPPQNFPTQFVVVILSVAFIGTGFINERLKLFKYLGSLMLMSMGVLTLYPGYSFINWTTLMGKGFGFVQIGLGFIFLIEDSFSRDKQQETFTQEDENDGRYYGND